ncbi:MAG: T9SS type A sorting domain-containing protein [Bacteroidota bacterium]|nr:T9SS type A sorting domain-containing protein [Bacteroidota bacterium]
MKTLISMLATIIIVCLPKSGFSDPATINSNLSASEIINVYSWQNNIVERSYSMENFEALTPTNYKIIPTEDSPNLIEGLTMWVHVIEKNATTNEIIRDENLYLTSRNGYKFEYIKSDNVITRSYDFNFNYTLPSTAPLNQTQLVKFEIRKQNLLIWDWQSTFYYYLTTGCTASWNFATGTLSSGDHEVSNYLTASVSAFPNGGITELDGGSSVTLLPGFSSNLSGGGAILIINDGCGGAYRLSNPVKDVNDGPVNIVNYKNDNISIYPNPTNDLISIIIPNATAGEKIKVETRDINGRVLFSEERTHNENSQLDLKDLKPGLYFISISGSDLNYNQKIIKQ